MNAEEHFAEGVRLFEANDFGPAIEHFTAALRQDPRNPGIFYNRALSYVRLADYPAAIADYDAAIFLDEENPQLFSYRGVAHHLSGDNAAALADLDRAAEIDPQNPYRYSSRAYVRAKAGDVQGGIEDYRRAVALDPEDAIAYNNLGLLEEQLGYREAAQRSFERSSKIINYQPEQRSLAHQEKDRSTRAETLGTVPSVSPSSGVRSPGAADYLREMRHLIFSRAGRQEVATYVRRWLKR